MKKSQRTEYYSTIKKSRMYRLYETNDLDLMNYKSAEPSIFLSFCSNMGHNHSFISIKYKQKYVHNLSIVQNCLKKGTCPALLLLTDINREEKKNLWGQPFYLPHWLSFNLLQCVLQAAKQQNTVF
jgi:hypothetical protein